jgi:hypothetical protein
MNPLQVGSRANPAAFANKSRKKLGTLTDSAHVRTVHVATADYPDRGPSSLRAGPSAGTFGAQQKCTFTKVSSFAHR